MILIALFALLHSYFLFETVMIRPNDLAVVGVERWVLEYRKLLGMLVAGGNGSRWIGEFIVAIISWAFFCGLCFQKTSGTLWILASAGLAIFHILLAWRALCLEDLEV